MYMKRDRKEMEDPEVAAWPMYSVVVQSKAFSLNTTSLKLGSAVILPWVYRTVPFGSLCKHIPVLIILFPCPGLPSPASGSIHATHNSSTSESFIQQAYSDPPWNFMWGLHGDSTKELTVQQGA